MSFHHPEDKHPVPKVLRGWVLPLLLLALWWLSVHFHWTTSLFLVPLDKVWDAALKQVCSGELWIALEASLQRDLIGFAIGVSAGLLFGVLFGLSRMFERMIGPTFHAFKQISLFAWIPLLSVWFGLGDAAKVAFLSLTAFFPVVLNTYEGIRSVPSELVEVARVLKFNRFQWLFQLIFPAALPSILVGIHLALLYVWLGTLGAEYLLVSGKGIGNMIIDGSELFLIDQVIFGMIVLAFVGFLLSWIVAHVERRLLSWRGRSVAQF